MRAAEHSSASIRDGMLQRWKNDAAYNRCVFLSQYVAKNKIEHPRAVCLREDQLLPSIDRWLAQVQPVPCRNSHMGSELVFSVPVRLLSGTR
ncbi:MAG: hypothetical protein ACR2MP_30565 [Streptosporangiaceae bacterium]